MAYNAGAGLITSDAGGSVMRWNMQSGQVLSTMSLSASSVQSVRFSNDGNELAVLTGLWNEPTAQVLHVADSRTLETIRTARLQYSAAVVVPSASGSWLAVDWSGTVWEVESQAVAGRVSKEHVSALVLTQNQSPNMRDLNFIFFESQALPSPETLR